MAYEHIVFERSTFSRQGKRGMNRMEDTYITICRYSPLLVPICETYDKTSVQGTERNNDRIKLENFYYTTIYGVLQEPDQRMSKTLQ